MTSERLPSAAPSLARLIQELTKLPGIGPKSAQRLAYYIIQLPNEEAFQLADAVYSVKHTIMFCEECQNLADANLCGICSNPQRDRSQVCVVEEPMDVLALERANCYYGLYHVLHGAVSPLNGITPATSSSRSSTPACPTAASPSWSSPPTPPSTATPPPCSSPASWKAPPSASPAWPGACPSAVPWNTPTRPP